MTTETIISELPFCDICSIEGNKTPALYDAKTTSGPWAYLCKRHFYSHTDHTLGTGKGQKLVVKS